MCLDITLLPNPATQKPAAQNQDAQNIAAHNPHGQFPGTGTTVFPLPGTFPWSAGVRGEEIKIMYFCRQRRKDKQTKTQRQTDISLRSYLVHSACDFESVSSVITDLITLFRLHRQKSGAIYFLQQRYFC